jgi:hypothetical protein
MWTNFGKIFATFVAKVGKEIGDKLNPRWNLFYPTSIFMFLKTLKAICLQVSTPPPWHHSPKRARVA